MKNLNLTEQEEKELRAFFVHGKYEVIDPIAVKMILFNIRTRHKRKAFMDRTEGLRKRLKEYFNLLLAYIGIILMMLAFHFFLSPYILQLKKELLNSF